MGCPNYFKFHPDATVHDYMKKFNVDSYEKAVDEIKSLGLESHMEKKILEGSHPDIANQHNMYDSIEMPSKKTEAGNSEKYEEDKKDQSEPISRIDGLYLNKIQKILEKIYDDSETDDREREEIIDALYGQLKELTSYMDPGNRSEDSDDSEKELSEEEKLKRIKRMLDEIRESNKAVMDLPEFDGKNIFESQLMDIEQFDFFKK
jgi:hypothetical protein